MNVQYSQWRQDSETAEDRARRLSNLFTTVLLYVNADAERALEILQSLQDRYGVLGDMSMDEYMDLLKAKGLLQEGEDGKLRASKKAQKKLRSDALMAVFRDLKKSDVGQHETPMSGSGSEKLAETRSYTFGDPASNIDVTETLRNAYTRSGHDAFTLHDDDIRVHETEHLSSCATVLLIDISHSMILYGEDRITPAKRVALALAELITTKFPKDQLEVVVFGDEARRVQIQDIPFIEVGPFHTNTLDGIRMARTLLKRSRAANKQIFMVTDGKPSAMFDEFHRLYKNPYGLDPRIINKTLDEAVAARREGIVISTFMVTDEPVLVHFVEEMTRANRGRAMYANLDGLGQSVFVDYLRNRRSTMRGGFR
jgi:uncharacterized protein with von Willebrand factor type A (vWA) domain